ncbi:hypothetical protein MMC13_002591 [Lambiella insularis]|nr:hypothetical protein [Lambiella insularis]
MGGGVDFPTSRPDSPVRESFVPAAENEEIEKGFTVLVTGFGPFPSGDGNRYEHNTSHLITQLLPPYLDAHSRLNTSSKRIKILNPTAPDGQYVKTEYAYIRRYIQELYDSHGETVDLVLHLGMADGWNFYTVEQCAYKEGFTCSWWGRAAQEEGFYYGVKDYAGKTAKDITEAEGKDLWCDAPVGLAPKMNVKRVAKTAQVALRTGGRGSRDRPYRKPKVRAHRDAGDYCCGFIFYESLATCWGRGLKTDVLFCHVPGESDRRNLETGRDVVLAIIGAACVQMGSR